MSTFDLYMSDSQCGENSDNESGWSVKSANEDDMEEFNEGYGSMDPALYRAAISGDIKGIKLAPDDPELSLINHTSPQKNTILHIAASRGHDHLVQPILNLRPLDYKLKNSAGDLPIHLASSSGHTSTVKALFLISDADTEVENILTEENMERNIPLHLALKNHHKEVAELLFRRNRMVVCFLNEENKSPLYMAVEARYLDFVTEMMNYIVETPNRDEWLKAGKSIVHAAIRTRNKEMLEKLLSYEPSLMNSIDENGRRPLSYAASIGFLEGISSILKSKEFTKYPYMRDRSGFYPIHTASENGHSDIVREFLEHYPDSRELLNREGRNILHTAAQNGKSNTVCYMLKVPELENLINGRDKEGNTPLHLATKNVHPKVVSILTWDKRIRLELVNNKDMTALNIAEDYKGSIPSFQQRLTWQALRYANAPRTVHLKTRTRSNRQSSRTQSKKLSSKTQSKKHHSRTQSNEHHSRIQSSVENYKDRVNTLLLVAILVVTVTFAAGFTMPGGYNSSESDPNKGLATFFEKHAFHVFLISNTIAMYSSMVVAVVLIWAQLGDVNLIIASLNLALPLLGIALTMVSSAFMAGAYLVVSKLTWLAYFILITGSVFLLTVLVLFVPLFLPSSLNHHVLRYIFYYPFYLLVLVTDRNRADHTST